MKGVTSVVFAKWPYVTRFGARWTNTWVFMQASYSRVPQPPRSDGLLIAASGDFSQFPTFAHVGFYPCDLLGRQGSAFRSRAEVTVVFHARGLLPPVLVVRGATEVTRFIPDIKLSVLEGIGCVFGRLTSRHGTPWVTMMGCRRGNDFAAQKAGAKTDILKSEKH